MPWHKKIDGTGGQLAHHVGRQIKRLRAARNWSQAELALQTGVSTSAICRFERGTYSPSLTQLEWIAGALEVPPAHFLVGYKSEKI